MMCRRLNQKASRVTDHVSVPDRNKQVLLFLCGVFPPSLLFQFFFPSHTVNLRYDRDDVLCNPKHVFVCQTLAGLPDQDSYYDMVDCLEEQGIEAIAQRHLSRKGTDLDLVEQFNIYEVGRPTR